MADAKREIAGLLTGKQPGGLLSDLGRQPQGLLSDLGNYFSPSNQSWAPWPVKAVRSGLAALAAPGDAYSGALPMMDLSGHTSLDAIGRATDLAGLMTLGAGAVPAEQGMTLNAGLKGLRERYSTDLNKAVNYSKDVGRIKLTPERMEAAKASLQSRLSNKPRFGEAPSPYRQTPQAQAAAEYAAAARQAGIDDVRVKFADGAGGSVYVRTGDHGTVRFADHPAPEGYYTNPVTGKEQFGAVGGYSKELGRRHYPATVDVSPQRTFGQLNTQPAYDFLAALLRGDGT